MVDRAQARAMLAQIADAILDTVRSAGSQGAPSGYLYAALMGVGCSLGQYEAIMAALVNAGKLRKSNHCYFVVE